MKKSFILLLPAPLLVLSMVSCKGPGSATTADSTKLYSGPVSRLDSIAARDSARKDSLRIGPDDFNADSVKKPVKH